MSKNLLPEASIPNEQITIVFDKTTTHQEVIRQFVDKLFTHDFASREEIVENLKVADILLDIELKNDIDVDY